MSSSVSHSPDRFLLAAFAEDRGYVYSPLDSSQVPALKAQREEPELRLIDCTGVVRNEEVTPVTVLNPYADTGAGQADQTPSRRGWWLSGVLAIAVHVAALSALLWMMPSAEDLSLAHGEIPQSLQATLVRLEKKPDPEPPAAAPAPAPPEEVAEPEPPPVVEPPKPVLPPPKPEEKVIPKPKPKPVKSKQPPVTAPTAKPSAAPPSAAAPAPVIDQPRAGAPTAAAAAPAGVPMGSVTDSDIRPLRMDPPDYPIVQHRRNITGYVRIEFMLGANGRVSDIQIVESVPRGAFDRVVKAAVAKWRFQPRIKGGKIVPRRVSHKLEFKLD